ncbi:MAG TPA: hypothetical protein VEJ63_18980 [Planctomycetota bacterium]|nr:hypothetical protein [Planctomycetota bacterium]
MQRVIPIFTVVLIAGICLAEDDAANLRMKLNNGESVRYDWSIQSTSQSKGRELGKAFTLSNDKKVGMTVSLRGLARAKNDTIPIAMRINDWTLHEKNSITGTSPDGKPDPESTTEVILDKKRVKAIENGTVRIDSDNDVGLDKVEALREYVKGIENTELRVTLDPAGRQSEMSGDSPLVEQLKTTTQGIFPILAGKEMKPGESWEDTLKIPKLGVFRLAKPAVVRSKMTFVKWVEKDGRKLASIDMVSAWEKADLRGENDNGLLVEISKVEGLSAGTCLFDPNDGQFTEGTINVTMNYRIDGEKDGQATGLDVTGKTLFTFTRK